MKAQLGDRRFGIISYPLVPKKRDLHMENLLICAIFLLSCSDIFVLLIAPGVLVITQRMLHRESHRKKLLLAVYLIGVFDFLKLKGESLLPVLILQKETKNNYWRRTRKNRNPYPSLSLHCCGILPFIFDIPITTDYS